MSGAATETPQVETRLSSERLLGTAQRWRRRGAPVPASASDPGVFGPGSIAWEVLLHPATLVLETTAQGTMQLLYRPIAAGIRDVDPISLKGQDGTLTFFDSFERFQRNSGMHAPMWLGDTATAEKMAAHLNLIHRHVKGPVIDAGEPELGGYAAAEPRDAMWAALTELHPILRAFEAFAFREGRLPHRMTPAQRDQYVREAAAYLRLVGAEEEEIPHSTAELAALYDKYADLFRHSDTMHDLPATGQDHQKVMAAAMIANFHPSQLRAVLPLVLLHIVWELPVMGALSSRARRSAGYSPARSLAARAAAKLSLPVVWVLQQSFVEQKITRLMWGPDAVELIEHARELHARRGFGLPAYACGAYPLLGQDHGRPGPGRQVRGRPGSGRHGLDEGRRAVSEPVSAQVQALREGFDSQLTVPLSFRREQLLALDGLLADHGSELEDALAADLGRHRLETHLVEVRRCVPISPSC